MIGQQIVRLQVYNIPENISIDEFRQPFCEFKGFKDAQLVYNDKTNCFVGYVDFVNFEQAEHCKKFMNNYKFPGTKNQGLFIDFIQYNSVEYQNPAMDYYSQSQYPNQSFDSYQGKGHDASIHQFQDQPYQAQMNQQFDYVPQQNQMEYQQVFNINNFKQSQAPRQTSLNQIPQYQQMSTFEQNQTPQQIIKGPQVFQAAPGLSTTTKQIAIPPKQQYAIAQQQFGQNTPINNQAQQQQQQLPNMLQMKGLNFQNLALFKVPPNATPSLYVDGVPLDATEREVAHIFRPFPGFKSSRLIKKVAQTGREFYFCFADFETPLQSSIAMQTLQGYRFDKNDVNSGLRISYATDPKGYTQKDKQKYKQYQTGYKKTHY